MNESIISSIVYFILQDQPFLRHQAIESLLNGFAEDVLVDPSSLKGTLPVLILLLKLQDLDLGSKLAILSFVVIQLNLDLPNLSLCFF